MACRASSSYGRPALLLLLTLIPLVISDPRPDLPFIGCAAPEGNRQRCYFYVQEEKTWDEADKACRSHKGAYLATIPDYQTRIFLSEAARPRQNGVWIGGKKEPQHQWSWNTARPYLHKVIENRTEPDAELCGYINSTDPTIIRTTPCTTKLKYICSESELTSIYDPHFVSPYRHWIWYSAKLDCLNRGMDLAVVKDDNLDIIHQLLEAEVEEENDPRYWLGLSTSKYIWAHNGKEMDHILFSCGEPSHSTEHCIEMLDDGKYGDTRCEEKRPYICEWVKEGHEMFDIGCLGTRCFYYVEEPMNWNDANRTCRQYTDTFLGTIPDYHTQFYLNSKVTELFLTKRKDQSAIMGRTNAIQNGFWIGGHNIFYYKWRFMNGKPYLGDVDIEDPFKDYHCGAFLPDDNAIHGLPCNYKHRFLCLTTDPDADVLKEENHFISSAQTQVLDWFKARINCLDRGMELASGSMELLQQILTGETGNFWVGLTRSRYVWEHSRKPLDHLTFRCGEPNNYEGLAEHCVEMWLDGEYNDGLCSKLKPFVCEWDRAPVPSTLNKPPYFVLEPAERKSHAWMYAAILGFVGWALAIVSLTVAIRVYCTNLAQRKKLAAVDIEIKDIPCPNTRIELDNQDDPTLDDLLNEELFRVILNAVANGIHRHLPLSSATELWAILEANDVVNQVTKEQIQGNNNSKTNVEQVAGLFEHLRRGTNRRYYYFKAALLKGGYPSVVRHYLDCVPETPLSAGPGSPKASGSTGSSFPFPPTATASVKAQAKTEEQPCSSLAAEKSGCQANSNNSNTWSRGGRFLRSLLADPSKSHSSTIEDIIIPDSESKDEEFQK